MSPDTGSVHYRISPADLYAHRFEIRCTVAQPDRNGKTPERPAAEAKRGFGRYRAASYDELIDHPVEMGDFVLATFDACNVPHDIALSGVRDVAVDRLQADLARVCQWQIGLFGGVGAKPPFERYLFLVNATDHGHGGLEHRSSTSLVCSRTELPAHAGGNPTATGIADSQPRIDDAYLRFLGLAGHEYFHSWNVKRITPAAFVPYDLAREAYTRQLWIFEGVTSYYDDLALLRCGLIDAARYLELVARSITTLLRTPGRGVQTLGDASFDAWIKHYRPDADTPNAAISYYLKGSLVALALDLTLRREGRTSLDDVMRTLWQRFGTRTIGVPENGFRAVAEELAGRSLAAFFASYVDGTAELPLAELLDVFGIELNLRASAGASDKGGKPAAGPIARSWFGASVDTNLALRHVFTAGPAERAGLAPGDVLVALDGLKATAETFAALAMRRAPGESVDVHAFRDGVLQTHVVELGPAPRDTAWLTLRESTQPCGPALRRAWLGA
jgi:predicted metalloprotease with PDZ domain